MFVAPRPCNVRHDPRRPDRARRRTRYRASPRGRFTFLFVATPSRSEIEAYSALSAEVAETVASINQRFGTARWTPIIYVNENVDAPMLAAIYRAADLWLVSSLQDGMNLVAKEFIACQVDDCGVLVLSRFAGAAEEIDGAVPIDPSSLDGFARGIRDATIFGWLDDILSRVATLTAASAPAASAT